MSWSVRVGWLLLTALAFGLRAYHVDFGLPVDLHPDEVPATRQVAAAVQAGSLSLHSYYHPPLLRELAWLLTRALQPWQSLGEPDLSRSITLNMRWISVLAGTGSVPVVGLIATRFVSMPWAFLAALLWATSPISVFQAKYATPDMLMCLLLTLGWYVALRLGEWPSLKLYVLGGFLLGLAVAAKYNAIFLLGSLVAAFIVVPSPRRLPLARVVVALVAGTALGLALGFPLLWWEWDDFVRTTLLEAEHQFVRGHRGIKISGSDYFYAFHFLHSVWPSTGTFLLLLIVLGLVHFALQPQRLKWILLATLLPYYLAMEQALKLTFSPQRYVLPLLPIYFVAAVGVAAACVRRIFPASTLQRCLGIVVATGMAMLPLYQTLRLLTTMVPDTRLRAAQWLVQNVPQPASVAIGGLIAFYPPLTRQQFPRLTQFGREESEYSVLSSFDYEEAFAHPEQTRAAYEFYTRVFATQDLVYEAAPTYESFMFHNPTIKVFRRRASKGSQ